MTAEQGSTRETAISRNGERAADPAAAAAAAADDGGDGKRWIVFVMGATASGKTGMAQFLAKTLDAKFIEGDDANIDKMSHGQPLDDEDRAGWLQAISEHAVVHLRGPGTHHLVVTCSALKHDYRALLRQGAHATGDLRLLFVFLDVPEAELVRRADARAGHYAKGNLVHSQVEILERPGPDEPDVLTVDGNQPLAAVRANALAAVQAAWAAADRTD